MINTSNANGNMALLMPENEIARTKMSSLLDNYTEKQKSFELRFFELKDLFNLFYKNMVFLLDVKILNRSELKNKSADSKFKASNIIGSIESLYNANNNQSLFITFGIQSDSFINFNKV